MTWREYVLLVRGFRKKQSLEFEHTRAICYYIYAVNTDSKGRVSMKNFWPLFTDREEIGQTQEEEYKEIFARERARHKQVEQQQLANAGL